MSAATEKYEDIAGGVQFLATRIGSLVGGPFGAAYATFLTGQNSWVASVSDLVSKVDSGTATWEDYADVASRTLSTAVAIGILTGTLPETMTLLGLTGAVNLFLTLWKKHVFFFNEASKLRIPYSGGNDALITNLETRFQQAQTTRSPLVLDLDGDGVETIASSKKGVHFDLDKSGFAEQAGWVGKDDGLLVRDLNGDGKITHGGELFGNHTVLKSGGQARNGFEALKDLDDNNDGRVDAQDSAYASLRVWQDLNSDGITEDGELLTLAQAGVEGLSVSYIEQGADAAKDAQGNQHQQLGTYTRSEGSTQQMHDVWFSVDTARTVNLNTVAVSDEIAALPELRGMGNVASLRQTLAQDAAVGSPEYFRSMGEQYIYSALQSGAIAAGWEVQTAKTQSALGDPMAGLTEVLRAQRANQYLGAQHITSVGSNGQLGTWRTIALDLNGDGIQTVAQDKSGVVFDVDGTGFAKQTAWVGKGDGMLVLDRNFNGVIDSGSELFGNTQVALAAQGLKGLAWVDANVDGNIDNQDAVYSQLRVWQDANGNGLVDNGEAKSLSDMGISSIHYNRGSYDKNGQSLQVSSVELAVDSVGTHVEQLPGGILVQTSDGKTSVLVTKTDDLSNIAPGKDRVQGIEDVQLDILTASLLANDKVMGSNKSLTITAVGDAQHAANGTTWRITA